MKKFFYAIVIVASVVLFSCNSNTIDLKFNLPKGAGYDYNMDMIMSVKGNANGQPVNVDNKMAMGYHFGVTDDSAGWKKISSTISHIAMKLNAGGMNIDYDSDKPLDTSDIVGSTVGKVLNALKGAQFAFTMNEKGQIGSVTGINDMMQRMMSSVNVPGGDAMAQGMGSSFNEDNFKQNIQQAFGAYPGKPVKPGDTWTATMNMNNSGVNVRLDNTYTLVSVLGNNADVKVDSKISSAGNAGFDITGTMAGTMQYDVPTGVPVNGNLEMKMSMNTSSGGQSTPMNMDINMKISGKKS